MKRNHTFKKLAVLTFCFHNVVCSNVVEKKKGTVSGWEEAGTFVLTESQSVMA